MTVVTHFRILLHVYISLYHKGATYSRLNGCHPVVWHNKSIYRYLRPEAAFEGDKWGDRPRPRSWGGPELQASDVDKQSTLEIKQIIVFNLCLHVIW